MPWVQYKRVMNTNKHQHPSYEQVTHAWNAQADEHNQWDDLGEDEKIEWAAKYGAAQALAAPAEVSDDVINTIADGLFDHQQIGGKVPGQDRDEFRELIGAAIAVFALSVPAAQAAVPTAELKAILADADIGPPVDTNWCCLECGKWTPWQHPEAHDHEDDCSAPSQYAQRRKWKARLSALIAAASQSAPQAMHTDVSDFSEIFAWATFDGEGGYDLRLYADNESYRDEYIQRNGLKYAGWVIALTPLSASAAASHLDGQRQALGLPGIDRSAMHSAELRMERKASTHAPTQGVASRGFETADGVAVTPGQQVWVFGTCGLTAAEVDKPVTNYLLWSSPIPVSKSYSSKEAALAAQAKRVGA